MICWLVLNIVDDLDFSFASDITARDVEFDAFKPSALLQSVAHVVAQTVLQTVHEVSARSDLQGIERVTLFAFAWLALSI